MSERSGGLEERVPLGRADNNVGGRQKAEAEELAEEAASIATSTGPNQSTELNGVPPPPDDEGFVWPEGTAPAEASVVGVAEAENEPEAPLPKLDDLVKRIPEAARETLDELFRAKFVSVKRVDKSTLKA